MSSKPTKGMTLLFHCKFLVVMGAFTLFFNNCRPEKIDSPKKSTEVITASGANKSLAAASLAPADVPLKNMFGINGYEWNFLQNPANPNLKSTIYEANMNVIKSFSSVRHYLNWGRVEVTKGNYTFSPSHDGSWDYDLIYTRCKQDGIMVLADLKNIPPWMMSLFPGDMQDNENAPAPYGLNKSDPASYIDQAHMAFQFAARYGYNSTVDPALVKVDPSVRWTNDPANQVKIGLSLVKFIECDNERDKWWKGPATKQTPEEYAANMSAFYDGNKGRLGKGAGVKAADPHMQVVMGGLATCDVTYVQRMIEWCRVHRGYKTDGSVNLCFDVINYHMYSNDGNILLHSTVTTGVAPELSFAGPIADSFVALSNGLPQHPHVWVTEAGYDINQQSYQKAIAIGNKSVLLTQADWILRSSLLYMRHGISRLFFYQLLDDNPNGPSQYATSGLAEDGKRRPAADYIFQASKLMGNYVYQGTINADPLVDKYQLNSSIMYVLTIPDQIGRTGNYLLNVGTPTAEIYTLNPGSDNMIKKVVATTNGILNVAVSETPVFVKGVVVK